mmetsp:Transcript_31934/g.81009  ORF Transcript_31934/g.81009 Transcript_31934/m.81009 type:complete len:207 (+) Transcript_31934:118-738(+)
MRSEAAPASASVRQKTDEKGGIATPAAAPPARAPSESAPAAHLQPSPKLPSQNIGLQFVQRSSFAKRRHCVQGRRGLDRKPRKRRLGALRLKLGVQLCPAVLPHRGRADGKVLEPEIGHGLVESEHRPTLEQDLQNAGNRLLLLHTADGALQPVVRPRALLDAGQLLQALGVVAVGQSELLEGWPPDVVVDNGLQCALLAHDRLVV